MTEEEVEVCSVGGEALSIVVESEDCPVWQRDPPDALTPTVVAVLVFIDIVAQVYHVVNGIFAYRVSKGIEEAKGEIAARIDSNSNLSGIVCNSRRGFGAAHWTGDIGRADLKLVVILREWRKSGGFNLTLCEHRNSSYVRA